MHMRPAMSRPRSSRQVRRSPPAALGATPAFCGSSPALNWGKDRGPPARPPPPPPVPPQPLRESFGDPRPVNAVDGIEQLDRIARLVRLQRADEMQLDAR